MNEEALAHWGLSRQKQTNNTNYELTVYFLNYSFTLYDSQSAGERQRQN